MTAWSLAGVMDEHGKFLSFSTMASDKFSTVAVLIGVAIVLGCLQVITLGLSFCLSSNVVFMACGWMMAGSGESYYIVCFQAYNLWKLLL